VAGSATGCAAGPFPVSRLELREDLAGGPEVESLIVEGGPAGGRSAAHGGCPD
jgi:hypothetical protein